MGTNYYLKAVMFDLIALGVLMGLCIACVVSGMVA